jgi:hypothetical protein
MTTETEKALEAAAKEEESGFAQGFTGEVPKEPVAPEATPTPTPTPEAKTEEVKKEEAAPTAPSPVALTAEDIAAIRAAAQELPSLKEKLREAHGRIGALNDLVKQSREQKKEEAKAPVPPTAVALKRMTEHYPELAGTLSEDIAEVLAGIKPAEHNPEDIARLVNERVAEVSEKDRKQMLADEHPDWEDIKKGEALWTWIDTLPKEEAAAFKTSTNPLYVAKKLTVFKDWLDKASKAKEDSQKRLEANVTPQGANRPSNKPTMSDEEAMMKGFAEGFNS